MFLFWHPEKKFRTLEHGDDYVSAGNASSMTWLETELAKAHEIQTQKMGIGKDYQQEGKVLNRPIR